MNQLYAFYLDSLQTMEWQPLESFVFPTSLAETWLMEQGSLSHRLEQHCDDLSISQVRQKRVDADYLTVSESALISKHECLVREVVLCGDAQEWVLGRTLIPKPSLRNNDIDLSSQGDIPLGITVFSAENVRRDHLQLGCVNTDNGPLLARRSRLWMNEKPMLVAELFLPDSPIYQQNDPRPSTPKMVNDEVMIEEKGLTSGESEC